MNHTKSSFIKLALDCQALRFGEFTLKSGRISPYFFNAGLFYQGNALKKLGTFYANILLEQKVDFEHLFGPAYKGLPLATATAIALTEAGKECTVTFNRKEFKGHGEGGQLIGAPLTGKTIIIDDVITAGTAFRESQKLIKEHNGDLTGVIIALDRCERGTGAQSTLAEIQSEGIKVFSIINLYDLIEYLKNNGQFEQVKKMEAYQELYGCGA
ncbi:MAG: orotate phosphoribosyltransferase [Legionella sp.]|nr:orotate phosphoribosyltransferase [Legionella sp.]